MVIDHLLLFETEAVKLEFMGVRHRPLTDEEQMDLVELMIRGISDADALLGLGIYTEPFKVPCRIAPGRRGIPFWEGLVHPCLRGGFDCTGGVDQPIPLAPRVNRLLAPSSVEPR